MWVDSNNVNVRLGAQFWVSLERHWRLRCRDFTVVTVTLQLQFNRADLAHQFRNSQIVVVDSLIAHGDEVKHIPSVGLTVRDDVVHRAINGRSSSTWSEPHTLVNLDSELATLWENALEIVAVCTINADLLDTLTGDELEVGVDSRNVFTRTIVLVWRVHYRSRSRNATSRRG